jgi:hypothetical protein
VWEDFRNGNSDIYRVTLGPDCDVSPMTYDFGDVEIGFTSSMIATVSNVGSQNLMVNSIDPITAPDCGKGPDPFGAVSGTTLPTTLEPGQTLDVTFTFAPTVEATCGIIYRVDTNELNGFWGIELSGTGVPGELPPSQHVEQILDNIETFVGGGTLSGSGEGGSAGGRLGAFTNMIEATGDLIENGQVPEACQQLADAYKRTDGVEKPPDFVTGGDAAALAEQIQALITSLGCP